MYLSKFWKKQYPLLGVGSKCQDPSLFLNAKVRRSENSSTTADTTKDLKVFINNLPEPFNPFVSLAGI